MLRSAPDGQWDVLSKGPWPLQGAGAPSEHPVPTCLAPFLALEGSVQGGKVLGEKTGLNKTAVALPSWCL